MFVLFFLFWVMLNGRITVEITLFGLVISAGYVCIRMQIHRIQFQKGYVDCKETAVDHWILFHFD